LPNEDRYFPVTVGIVDCGIANLGSISRIVRKNVSTVRTICEPEDFYLVDKIILPGVGAFPAAMARLETQNLIDPLRDAVLNRGIPVLGICLGMQLLASVGNEFEKTPGLNLIPGVVELLEPQGVTYQVPHVGWNSIEIKKQSPILDGIENQTDFYFVHSYRFQLSNEIDLVASTDHGGDFPSIISHGSIFGTQFHPEKSSIAGTKLIRNFCGM
jgi:glutamine amidotransferase